MHAYLKIKIVSLAAEAQLIRSAERKIKAKHVKWRAKVASRAGTLPPDVFFGLKTHRTDVVRQEARCAQLAYGFLRGNVYRTMEATCHRGPNWKRVEELVKKYGEGDTRDLMQRFSAWKGALPPVSAAA
jgi:hypothetical protein